jgi:hypothetical protein
MKKLLEAVTKLTVEELKNSYEKFPKFNSPHEGYAVILEEVEELIEEINDIGTDVGGIWTCVKYNKSAEEYVKYLKKTALNAASEAIQVAAMAQKFIDSFEAQNEQ